MTDDLMQQLKQAILDGDEDRAAELAAQALQMQLEPLAVVQAAVQPAMDLIGEQYRDGMVYLPELVLAGDAAKAAMSLLIGQLGRTGGALKGTVVLGVVYGDNHDIGKNLVQAVLSANGYRVIDLGVNCHPKAFIEAALRENADIIAMSTLITTSMPYQRQVIDTLKAMGKREAVYVIVGGGPITAEWTAKVGADGYGRDAKDALAVCEKLMASEQRPPLAQPLLENALATAH
jgi:methylmalonyl-CoA mutase cobalamin-binding domain/chain